MPDINEIMEGVPLRQKPQSTNGSDPLIRSSDEQPIVPLVEETRAANEPGPPTLTIGELMKGIPTKKTRTSQILSGLAELPGMPIRIGEGLIKMFNRETPKMGMRLFADFIKTGAKMDILENPLVDQQTKENVLKEIGETPLLDAATVAMWKDTLNPMGIEITETQSGFEVDFDPDLAFSIFEEEPERILENLSIILSGGALTGLKLAKEGSALSKTLKVAHTAFKNLDPIEASSTLTKRVIWPALKTGGRVAQGTAIAGLSFTSGSSPLALQRFADMPSKEALAAMRGGVSQKNILTMAREAYWNIGRKQSQRFADELAALNPEKWGADIDFSPVLESLDEQLDRFNVKRLSPDDLAKIDPSDPRFANFMATTGGKNIQFQGGALDPTEWNSVQNLVDIIDYWGTHNEYTPEGLHQLKMLLDKVYYPNRNSRAIVSAVRKQVKDEIVKAIPEYDDVMKHYQETQEVLDEIDNALRLEGKTESAMNKLTSSLNNNKEYRAEMIELLSEESGQDLVGMIAGINLKEWTPRGIPTFFALGGGLGGATIDPKMFVLIPASSRRFIGELMAGIGGTKAQAEALGRWLEQDPTARFIQDYLLSVETRQAAYIGGRVGAGRERQTESENTRRE